MYNIFPFVLKKERKEMIKLTLQKPYIPGTVLSILHMLINLSRSFKT